MTSTVAFITTILAIGTILMQFAIAYIIFCIIAKKTKILTYLEIFGSKIAFLVSLVALAASYFYSDFANFLPCSFCLIQRYTYITLALLCLILIKQNNRILFFLSLLVTGFGILVSGYHSILQINPITTSTPGVICAFLHSTISCSLRYFYEFGYISMPLMSFTGFALILVILIASHKHHLSSQRTLGSSSIKNK